MSLPGLGAFMGIAEEATWGTTVARTRYFPLRDTGDSLDMPIEFFKSGDINDAAEDYQKVFAGQRSVSGSVELELTFDGMLMLLEHAFGHTPTPSGAGPYVWAFEPPSTPDVVGKGLSIEILRSGSSVSSFLYAGCKITSLSIAASQNGIILATMEFLGKEVTKVAKSTPTAADIRGELTKAVFPNGQVTQAIQINGADRICRSFTFSYNNNYETRFGIESKTTLEPYRSSKVMGELSMELEFEDYAEFDDFLAEQTRAITIGIAQSATAALTIEGAQTRLVSGAVPFVNSMGIVTYNPTFELYADIGTTREFTFTVTNNDATIT